MATLCGSAGLIQGLRPVSVIFKSYGVWRDFFWFCFVFAIKKPLRYGTKTAGGNLPLEEKILLIRLRYKG